MSRKRGRYEDSDLRFLLEKNKTLERKIRSLVRENNRIKKERAREPEPPQEDQEPEQKVQEVVQPGRCPQCGSSNVKVFDLEIRGISYECTKCSACGKSSRTKK